MNSKMDKNNLGQTALPEPDIETLDRVPGALEGKIRIGQEFFEPLPLEELEAWE